MKQKYIYHLDAGKAPVRKTKSVIVLVPTGENFNGAINQNIVLKDTKGNKYLLRTAKGVPPPVVMDEQLTVSGFFAKGGRYVVRDPKEQVKFMKILKKFGLKAIEPLQIDKYGILLPFIEGMGMDAYLQSGNIIAVEKALNNLLHSHTKGVVYGDRWVKNTMITASGDTIELDFDIALEGENTKEFELAQTFSYIFYFSSNRKQSLQFLRAYMKKHKEKFDGYNLDIISHFTRNYATFYKIRGPLADGKLIAELVAFSKLLK